jgi:hypothetical protein
MKAFWALILVLVLAAGWMVLGELGGAGEIRVGAMQETAESTGDDVAGLERDLTEPIAITPESTRTENPNETPSDTAAEEPVVVDIGVADESTDPAEFQGEPAPLGEDAAVDSAETEALDETDTVTNAEGESETAYTLMLDERYGITGQGTAEDPYAIDFDMLVALEQDYEPKVPGKTDVPEWIKPLDDKRVIITGFIGFPFISPSADECMVMLNQWDGCCIGVPPTPYDAVEVQLAEPIDLQQGIINYGTLTGVFRTDPYLVNGWLIGLYVLDEARLESGGSKNQEGF